VNTTLPFSFCFGRHAGEPLATVVDADRDYTHWIMGQPFFRERYQDLYSELRRLLAKRLSAEYEEEKRARERASLPAAERFKPVQAAEFCKAFEERIVNAHKRVGIK
jgi:hypothetical protein